jgi:ABC-type phosphate transport system substrate-binding protein
MRWTTADDGGRRRRSAVSMRRRCLHILLLGALLGAGSPLVAGDAFQVIVNAANPSTVLPAPEVSRMFLHKALQWPSGMRVAPVDQPEDSPVRDAFSRSVHGKSAAAVKAYWQRMIFSGRDVPPPERANAEVLSLVRADLGAISYVAPGTPLGDGIKVLKITP